MLRIWWIWPTLITVVLLAAALGWWLRGRVEQPDALAGKQLVGGEKGDGRQPEPKKENTSEGIQPIITILTEAPGLTSEEVESLIAMPIESQVNGMPGVKRVRSASRFGTCSVWVDLESKANIFEVRQRLAERLQRVPLPAKITSTLAPISFNESEVLLISLRSTTKPKTPEERTKTSIDLRTMAEQVIRNRVLALRGVTEVVVTGGIRKQYQVQLDPERLLKFGINVPQVEEVLKKNTTIGAGGNLRHGDQELPVFIQARPLSLQDLEAMAVGVRNGRSILIKDVATVRFGGSDRLGDAIWIKEGAGPNNGPAVLLTVLKEPSTPGGEIDRLLTDLQQTLPPEIKLERETFTHEDLCISLQLLPGTSRENQDEVCRQAEAVLAEVPEIRSVWRRGGMVEAAEHLGWADTPVLFVALQRKAGRGREVILADIRARIAQQIPGVLAHLGRPVSLRLDCMGVGEPIAVKVFGDDLRVLQQSANEIRAAMSKVPGVVDLQIEPPGECEQLQIRIRQDEAARYGIAAADLAMILEMALKGRVVGEVREGDRRFELVVMYDDKLRGNSKEIGKLPVETAGGERVPIDRLAEILVVAVPGAVYRENMQRRIIVSCGVQGRDRTAVLADIRQQLEPVEARLKKLPGRYRIEYAGQDPAR
jgi:Cu/Ag efflux pump CusA